ncbi:MAG: hypothetical protein JWO31_954 [Phycisphaerales bacterium]|nr:hypothetical protein [Phycisphaerales bacterium]
MADAILLPDQEDLLRWMVNAARESGQILFRQTMAAGGDQPARIHLAETARRRPAAWADIDAMSRARLVWTLPDTIRRGRDVRLTALAFAYFPMQAGDPPPYAVAAEAAAWHRSVPPGVSDLAALGYRALNVFAARCFRRGLP